MAIVQIRRSVGDLVVAVYRGRFVIAAVAAGFVLLALAYSVTATPRYESSSSILLKFGREYVYRPEVGDDRPNVMIDRQDLVNSEIEILASRELIRSTIRAVGVDLLYPGIDADPKPFSIAGARALVNDALSVVHPDLGGEREDSALEKAATAFEGALEVSGVGKSDVVRISYQHQNPELAALAVNELIEQFKQKRLALFIDPQAAFLEAQTAAYQERLREAELAMEEFRQTHRLFDLDQQRTLLLERRSELEAELRTTENMIEDAQERRDSLEDEISRVDSTVELESASARDPVIDDANSQLLSLRLREQQLLARYLPSSQLVADVREEIRLVEDFLEQQQNRVSTSTRTGKNVVHEQLMVELVRARAEFSGHAARRNVINSQLERLDQQLGEIDVRDAELRQLQRDVEAQEAHYLSYREKLEEARISEDMNARQITNVSVIEPAVAALRPASPRKTLNIALALFFGLGAGTGAVMLGEYTRPRLTGVEKTERILALPVLATLPDRKG